jgi:hypothetical protein
MIVRLLPLVIVAVLSAPVRAGTVSVVVTGDSELQAALSRNVESWLRTHGHTVGEQLPADTVSSLINCMVIDDEGCARGVVDARTKSGSVVFSEIRKPRTKASNATTLIVYWLIKGKEPVGMRRACADCSEELLKSTLDEMLDTIVGASELARGKLELRSKPAGLTVILDNENIGITPVEREVPAGIHTIILMSSGRKVGERTLKIQPEVTAEITMTATIPRDPNEPRSRVLPGVALAVGGAAIVAGTILYLTSDVDDGTKFEYYDNRPVGIGVAAGGLAVAAVGAYLWFRSGNSDSTPVVAIDHHGGYVGWSRGF